MNYKIVSDSSSDIFALDTTPFQSVPLKIITDEKEFIDTEDLNVSEMTDYLKKYKGTSKSSCPNMEDYKDAFEGADGIFCITITRNLSGSYNSAVLAVEDYICDHPEVQAYVIDTLSAGPELALLVKKLEELIAENLSFDEIKERICEYKNTTHLLFCLESMRNLANNGRISHATAKMAGLLGIRAIGKASLEGTLEMVSKVRGADKAVGEIFDLMVANGYCGGRVRIHHCDGISSVESLKARICEAYPEADVTVEKAGALCSFYAEPGGYLVGYEGAPKN
ncbi:MAG: DegV family protein [Clostridia bacterium]|nr:DegV family protein [Clostridia bacterium]